MTLEEAVAWCAERGVRVQFFWLHLNPRVEVRIAGGAVITERDTYLEAVAAAKAEDDRRSAAKPTPSP